MRIDRRVNYKLVVDVESCPMDKDYTGNDIEKNALVYDIGWAVVDKRGNVYRTRSYIVKEIFFDEAYLMRSAYYADKLPQYFEDIKNGTRVVARWSTIKKRMLEDIETFGVNEAYAYNMRFDHTSTKLTQRWLTKSKYKTFIPSHIEICDIMKMARDVIAPMPSYKAFCEEHGFLTKHGRPNLKAETVYRFITDDPDFVESHTGLEDVLIEKDIMAYCYRQHKKMRRLLFEKSFDTPYEDPFAWVRPVL